MFLKNKIAIICGPTATGKTNLAIKAALSSRYEIINFDSLLFYKELNIGTAKPSLSEMTSVTHHLINICSIQNPINAADFYKMALPLIQKIHLAGKIPLLVGGSGFYLQTILQGMYPSQTTPASITQKSEALYQEKGIAPFQEILKIADPILFEKYHANDHYRIRRAVEHYWTTGQAFSLAQLEWKKNKSSLNKNEWDILTFYLDIPKEDHSPIITQRTWTIIQMGLLDEVAHLLQIGFSGNEKPMQSIGYKEAVAYIKNDLNDLNKLTEDIIIATRQLAKAQRTWFKARFEKSWNPLLESDLIVNSLQKFST